ncbi:MAG TPA: quinolinate synthase NadA, partial [Gemmatimonadales bacterium]|nr:quinolinate synthase NadA [Gemmatimonadales bacterium]
QEVTGRKLDIWLGECHVHAGLGPDAVAKRRRELPQAEVLIHPECGCITSTLYYMNHEHALNGNTRVCSTEQMMRRAKESPAREFVVATETGVLHRMRKENPEKAFYAVADEAECRFMKTITLENLRDSLRDLRYQVTVPPETAARARLAIERMLAIA